ncbi:putative transcription factor C2H2 family [Helianthus debilis subsp. tardiflorus]
MANLRPFFTNLISLFFFILLHLGCFIIFPSSRHHRHRPKPPSCAPFLRVSPTKLKRHKTISSSWSFIKRIFSSNPTSQIIDNNSKFVHIPTPDSINRSISTTRPGSLTEPDYFPIRHEIHPCLNCGEIFQSSGLLEQHQSIKHAVCELFDDDPGKNVVRMIFESGWVGLKTPTIHRVLKIHSSPKILTRFEEYRESVKLRAARQGGQRRRDERCIADGNELLRFHCTTFLCELGHNGSSSICTHQYCNVCGIIGSGFSPKLDGISTLPNSRRAHVAIPEDMEDEFRFMNVKRAMLVCRVIAGRVGCDPVIGDKDDPGYDSLVGKEPGAVETKLDDEDELIVFNPRAVLPCFVIVYTL